jgi:hypothetical protein
MDKNLLDHTLYHARSSKRKIMDKIAKKENGMPHPPFQASLTPNEGDNGLKRKKSFLEEQFK